MRHDSQYERHGFKTTRSDQQDDRQDAAPQTRTARVEIGERRLERRFAFDETGERIRASQGHSVQVDLELEPLEPPDTLFHGTTEANFSSILASGLQRMKRHHVHLSADTETAYRVGSRHGKAVILTVDSKAMSEARFVFYRSENGVWLTEAVPAAYIRAN